MSHNLLDEYAAAEHLGLTVHYLRAKRLKGRTGGQTQGPPYHKLGHAVRYSVEDLDAWVAAGRVDPCARKAEVPSRSTTEEGKARAVKRKRGQTAQDGAA